LRRKSANPAINPRRHLYWYWREHLLPRAFGDFGPKARARASGKRKTVRAGAAKSRGQHKKWPRCGSLSLAVDGCSTNRLLEVQILPTQPRCRGSVVTVRSAFALDACRPDEFEAGGGVSRHMRCSNWAYYCRRNHHKRNQRTALRRNIVSQCPIGARRFTPLR
jgi:hypothetical protein